MKWLLEHVMALLVHLFDNHHLCHSTWCHKKKLINDNLPFDAEDERNKKTYYRSMVNGAKLYDAMKEKYKNTSTRSTYNIAAIVLTPK